MAAGERSSFQPRYLTIPEVVWMYREKDKPLNGDTIRVLLEPLAGTSFLTQAIKMLRPLTKLREPIYTHELYLLFYGAFEDTVKSTNDQQQEDAITCLYHLSGFSVPLDEVYTMQWMQPDELLAREFRKDNLYHDVEKTQLAGSHQATQFRFFKAGTYRHTISVSMIEYQNGTKGTFHVFTQLSEGNLPHRFFSDVDRPPLPFIDPRQSSFSRTRPLLFISPQFSIEKAQPRPSL